MLYSVKAQYLNRSERVANNGKTYYNLAIMQDTQTAQLGCTKEIYDLMGGYEQLVTLEFYFSEGLRSGPSGSFVSRFCSRVDMV